MVGEFVTPSDYEQRHIVAVLEAFQEHLGGNFEDTLYNMATQILGDMQEDEDLAAEGYGIGSSYSKLTRLTFEWDPSGHYLPNVDVRSKNRQAADAAIAWRESCIRILAPDFPALEELVAEE